VATGHNALTRAIRHAEARDLVGRNVATLVETPKGQSGRPSNSLTLQQASALLAAAEGAEDPERVAIREALAFGKAVYDQRRTLGLSVADLAERAGMTADEIEYIEEGGTEPTIALLRRLAAALDTDVHLTAGHDLGSVRFEPHAA